MYELINSCFIFFFYIVGGLNIKRSATALSVCFFSYQKKNNKYFSIIKNRTSYNPLRHFLSPKMLSHPHPLLPLTYDTTVQARVLKRNRRSTTNYLYDVYIKKRLHKKT